MLESNYGSFYVGQFITWQNIKKFPCASSSSFTAVSSFSFFLLFLPVVAVVFVSAYLVVVRFHDSLL